MSLLVHNRRVVSSYLGISDPEEGIRVSAISTLSCCQNRTRTEHEAENHLHEGALPVLPTDTNPLPPQFARRAHPTWLQIKGTTKQHSRESTHPQQIAPLSRLHRQKEGRLRCTAHLRDFRGGESYRSLQIAHGKHTKQGESIHRVAYEQKHLLSFSFCHTHCFLRWWFRRLRCCRDDSHCYSKQRNNDLRTKTLNKCTSNMETFPRNSPISVERMWMWGVHGVPLCDWWQWQQTEITNSQQNNDNHDGVKALCKSREQIISMLLWEYKTTIFIGFAREHITKMRVMSYRKKMNSLKLASREGAFEWLFHFAETWTTKLTAFTETSSQWLNTWGFVDTSKIRVKLTIGIRRTVVNSRTTTQEVTQLTVRIEGCDTGRIRFIRVPRQDKRRVHTLQSLVIIDGSWRYVTRNMLDCIISQKVGRQRENIIHTIVENGKW